jgi:hypothetical protein
MDQVPGAKERSDTLYDIMQALTYVATQRMNVEERVQWQAQVPSLMSDLRSRAVLGKRFGGR